jgi:hypothetical protein
LPLKGTFSRLIGVYTGERKYQFGPVEVLPLNMFVEALHQGKIF